MSSMQRCISTSQRMGGSSSAAADSEAEECFRFLLLGKTGSGKSTTGNTILGGNFFNTGVTFNSVTSTCSLKRRTLNGRTLELLDSPGLFDTSKTQEEVTNMMVQALACMHPGPDAVLYVVMLGNRYTDEDYSVYNRLKAVLDDRVTKYLILLFTRGDALDTEASFEKILQTVPEQLTQVLQECGNRYVVFNNKAADKTSQVNRLLDEVRKLQAQNGHLPYYCPAYAQVGIEIEDEIARRMVEVEERELQSKKYVQKLQAKFTEAEQEAEAARKEFEMNEDRREAQAREIERQRKEEIEKLLVTLREQQADLERQRKEEMELRQRQEIERQEEIRRYERQRQVELEMVLKRSEESQRLMMERIKREKEENSRRMAIQEIEMNKLKDQIANNQHPICTIL